MSKVEDDYSDYIAYLSNANRNYVTLAGFASTSLALLITLLPNPSQMFAQITLFLVMFMYALLAFIGLWGGWDIIYFCRKVPPLTRRLKTYNYVSLSGYSLFGAIPVLLFLVKNLIYLALISAFVWIAFMIATYIICWKPFRTYHETRTRMLTRAGEGQKVI
jgi:hypothetical protein